MTSEKERGQWQDPFLEKLAECGNVTRSCKAAGISRWTAYRYRAEHPDFEAAWNDAVKIAVGLLEDEAWRRAREGTKKPVFYKGIKAGTIREYSDTLLIFLLKAHDKKYRDTLDVTTGGEKMNVVVRWGNESDHVSSDDNNAS